jgi:hypothetical protein
MIKLAPKVKIMNLQQKIKRVADATRGMKGLFQAELIHLEGCPARSTGNIISCICDFQVIVKRKNSDQTVSAKKQLISNRLAKRINEKSKKDIRH